MKSTPSPALRLPSSHFRLEPNSRRPLRDIGTVNNDKPSNDHDKSGDVYEKMQTRLSALYSSCVSLKDGSSLCLQRASQMCSRHWGYCHLCLTGLVCTKTPGFLFVKLRRESRTRYEDFCEDVQEKYVAFAQSDTEAPGEVLEIHMGLFQEETCCRTLIPVSDLALLLWPQPFFAGPHGDLCPRGQA